MNKTTPVLLLILILTLNACSPAVSPPDPEEPAPVSADVDQEVESDPPREQLSVDPAEAEEARALYPPHVSSAVLSGDMTVPSEIDSCLEQQLGSDRLQAYREGNQQPGGQENDLTALCLLASGIPPESLNGAVDNGSVNMTTIQSQYSHAPGGRSGWFSTGQAADLVLSAVGFNDSGGPLLFNHPGTVATDGTHLLLADRNNNRVLVWNSLPNGNVDPDFILGQPDTSSIAPGNQLDQMNWPIAVSAAEGKVVVADTYNDRILVWKNFPTESEPADFALEITSGEAAFEWPWGVWTDGTKLAVSATHGSKILIWNSFPDSPDQQPDVILTANGQLGTPRTITSNGQHLIVADHNAKPADDGSGMSGSATFVWTAWPTENDQPYDFMLEGWRAGTFTPEGLFLLSTTHYPPSLWYEPPLHEDAPPNVTFGREPSAPDGYEFLTGDGSNAAWAGGKLFLSLSNSNKIVVYNGIPANQEQQPDYAIGSPDIHTNTLDTTFIISNPVPATDGKSLFVSSDFDRRLYVWRHIPDENSAKPDFVYDLPEAPWDNTLWENTLVLAGKTAVYLWEDLPKEGELPDIIFNDRIGNVALEELTGVALDNQYFYIADQNTIYGWRGIPNQDSDPLFSIPVNGPGRLSSDGTYLLCNDTGGKSVLAFRTADLPSNPDPIVLETFSDPSNGFNLPQDILASHGHLFIADTGFNRVLIWENLENALSGQAADVILGAETETDISPEIGQDTLFWPAALAFDGSYLWVGEYKFSERLLRYSTSD